MGIYELLLMNEDIAGKIIDRVPVSQIVNLARKNGLRLLREDGWDKVRQGLTTPEEVVRNTAL
jgi:type II secretory ATPase GspE/PulE/Tfp pilus assembly ATPase PilB-like protein